MCEAVGEIYFLGKTYTSSVDIWSCGVVLYSMYSQNLPFNGDDVYQLSHNVVNNEPDYSGIKSGFAVDLIKRMLVKNPKVRLTAKEVISHPYIQKSPYAHIFKEGYFLNSETLVFPPEGQFDPKAISFLSKNDISLEKTTLDELSRSDNELAMFYKMVRKPIINSKLNNLFVLKRSSMLNFGKGISLSHSLENNYQHTYANFFGNKKSVVGMLQDSLGGNISIRKRTNYKSRSGTFDLNE